MLTRWQIHENTAPGAGKVCEINEKLFVLSFADVLEEFLTYAVKLEYDTEPDYEKCRKMFKDALKKAKYPLDGKIDFTSPKKAKKVGRTSSPVKKPAVKRKASAASKALRISDSSASASASEDDEDSFEEASAARKSKASPQKRSSKAKRATVLMKDAECQTSPAFVKAAKRQRKALASKAANNPEMEDFAKMAIDSAKKAKKPTTPRKSGGKVEKSKVNSKDEASLENPTPAMLALLAKKAEAESAKKKTKKKA